MTRCQTLTFTHPLVRALPLLGLTLWLQACGGDTGGRPQGAGNAAGGVAQATALVIQPLLDDDGNPLPSDPAARPDDAAAQTRSQRYALGVQAEQLLHAMRDRAVRVDAGCCGVEAVEAAVGAAKAQVQQRGLDADAPVLVYGNDGQAAATVADRLTAEGMGRVWVVTR